MPVVASGWSGDCRWTWKDLGVNNGDDPDHVEPTARTGMQQQLHEVLRNSQDLGFLGPGSVEAHTRHTQAFLQIIVERGQDRQRLLDLGSGGGVPGLVLALALPHADLVLLDVMQRRCRFLEQAVDKLSLSSRVEVKCGRAELLARDPSLRHGFDIVIARSFGAPAVTVECAVGFLKPASGELLVSEPPTPDPSRWPASGLEMLGLELGERRSTEVATVQTIRSVHEPDERYPRRTGVPAKRPLF